MPTVILANQHWSGEWVNELRIERIKCIVSERRDKAVLYIEMEWKTMASYYY